MSRVHLRLFLAGLVCVCAGALLMVLGMQRAGGRAIVPHAVWQGPLVIVLGAGLAAMPLRVFWRERRLAALRRGFRHVRLEPDPGDIEVAISRAAPNAEGERLRPSVYFSIDFLPSCQLIERSWQEPWLMEALQGVYLIEINLNRPDEPTNPEFDTRLLPAFYELDPRGKPTGRKLDSTAWDDESPESISAAIRAFFRGV
jgi:hypothetical protein